MYYEKKEQIENLFRSTPDIAKEIDELNGKDSVIAMFARHGIEVNEKDLYYFMKDNDILPEKDELPEGTELPEGEISDEELENVSGGFGLIIWAYVGAALLGAQAGYKIRRGLDSILYGDPDRTYPKKKK